MPVKAFLFVLRFLVLDKDFLSLNEVVIEYKVLPCRFQGGNQASSKVYSSHLLLRAFGMVFLLSQHL